MDALFTVNVIVKEVHELKSDLGQINMIVFEGGIDAPFFKGEILSGAFDTQKYLKVKEGMLSARYMLKGRDDEENECLLFIENNALIDNTGRWMTTPSIYTDSLRLKWLTEMKLRGEIEGSEKGVLIHFYEVDKK